MAQNEVRGAFLESLQLLRESPGFQNMKTFLITCAKIALVALIMWAVWTHFPALAAPALGVFALVFVIAALAVAAIVLGLSIGVVVTITVLAGLLSIGAALAPIWLPILAIVGLVALCRPRRVT